MTDPTVIAYYVTGVVLYFIIVWYFIRSALRVRRQLWNQKQIITLLMKIADKLGVERDENIQKIEDMNNNPSDEYIK